jgi:hypothetical protein
MKATVRFFRHGGIYGSDVSFFFKPGPTLTAFRPGTTQAVRAHRKVLRPTHRRDEFRPAIPQRDARQQSPSPLHRHAHPKSVPGSGTMNLQRTVNSVLTVCLSPGDHPRDLRRCPAISSKARVLVGNVKLAFQICDVSGAIKGGTAHNHSLTISPSPQFHRQSRSHPESR